MTKINTQVVTTLSWEDEDGDQVTVTYDTDETTFEINRNYGSCVTLCRTDIPTMRRALGKILKL